MVEKKRLSGIFGVTLTVLSLHACPSFSSVNTGALSDVVKGCLVSVTTGWFDSVPKGEIIETGDLGVIQSTYSSEVGTLVFAKAPQSSEQFSRRSAVQSKATFAEFDRAIEHIAQLVRPGTYERQLPQTKTSFRLRGCIPNSDEISAPHFEMQMPDFSKRQQMDIRSFQKSELAICQGGV